MNRRTSILILIAAAVLILLRPLSGWSIASEMQPETALYESHDRPDLPFDQFAAGRLGIIQPAWHLSYLYVAYRYLAGPGFDPSEQKDLVSYWNVALGVQLTAAESQWGAAGNGIDNSIAIAQGRASAVWIVARNHVPGVMTIDTIDIYQNASGPQIAFNGCNASAFLTAAQTLGTMIGKFGLPSPRVKEWVEAQDQALAECSRKPQATPTPGPEIPQPLTTGTPFEQAQRDYQIASAYFYNGNYDAAIAMFNAIAAQPSSPKRQLAPYLVARATIRKATLSGDQNDHSLLAQAEAQLNQIVSTSSDDSVKHSAQRLLGFVEAQLHPREREQELAGAVMLPSPGTAFAQNVSDYIWMLENKSPDGGGYSADSGVYGNDPTDWIFTLSNLAQNNGTRENDAVAHAIVKWQQTSSLRWLVAAIAGICSIVDMQKVTGPRGAGSGTKATTATVPSVASRK